ncbi:MAG TPA: nucleotidyltransferase family protein [Thermoanaerobaculia bacterium]|nr:nucleotidyltransferase family protein [Thermoanaerobaculia bacterium]
MNATLRIALPEEELTSFCRRWKITELSAFGSVLREDFGPESDIDLLVTFAPDAHWTLFDMARMRDELARLLGREVDLVTRRGVEASRNPIRREAILSSAEIIYAA